MMLIPVCISTLFVSCLLAAVDENPTAAGQAAATPQGSAVSVSDSEPVNSWRLRYRFQDGQKLRYETRQNMTLKAELGDTRRVDYSELKQRRVFTVQKVEPDGSARMAMQFEHVWMQKKVDSQEPVVFDSDMKSSEVPNAFRQVARELKGSAPKYWLSVIGTSMYPVAKAEPVQKAVAKSDSPKGPVINLVEGDSEQEKIQLVASSPVSDVPQEQKNQADPGSFLMTLPENDIKVGETWKETINVPVRLQNDINIEVPILRTFRLESVEQGIAKITFRCSIETPIRNVTVSSQLIQATPRGTISFDITRGIMLRREMQYDESVFGALGAESLLTSVGTNIEELIESEKAASEKAEK